MNTRTRGTRGEDFACEKLRQDGYKILARNWRFGKSEIDIIARLGDVIAFIEVKTRALDGLISPAQALSKAQRRRIVLAAVAYLREQGIYNTGECQPRFDLFEIVTQPGDSPHILRYAHRCAAYDTGDLDVFV